MHALIHRQTRDTPLTLTHTHNQTPTPTYNRYLLFQLTFRIWLDNCRYVCDFPKEVELPLVKLLGSPSELACQRLLQILKDLKQIRCKKQKKTESISITLAIL